MEGVKQHAITEAKKYYKIAMDEIKSASKNGKGDCSFFYKHADFWS